MLELISNNLVEPWLYGSKTGVSAVAILVSAVFWAWLWGGVGLILSTPLTVLLVVIGRYVPRLQFLYVLLSDAPSLSPEARLYQRLLAMDQEEAMELSQEYLKDHSLLELYDSVYAPALALAEIDRHRDVLDEARLEHVHRGMRDMIEELGEQQQRRITEAAAKSVAKDAAETKTTTAGEIPSKPAAASPDKSRPCIICLPAFDVSDELAGVMLAQLLSFKGACTETIGVDSLAGEMVEIIRDRQPAAVCVSALPPLAIPHSRYLCKRVSAMFPNLKMVVGIRSRRECRAAQDE